MKALTNPRKHTFLVIAVAISLYFGVHGYFFLKDKWTWPIGLAGSTIVLIEAIWLNVFRPKTYGKGVNLLAGIVAMTFCVFLPFLSSWSDFQKLEKKAAVAFQVVQPEYYAEYVIPALREELNALGERIGPRISLRNRALEVGSKEFSRKVLEDGSTRIYTGSEIASWIPSGKVEKEDFRRIEELINQTRQYLEKDREARNKFKTNQLAQSSKIAGLNADVDNGRMSFGFKGILIIALGLFSLYYMYSYSNPGSQTIDHDETQKYVVSGMSSGDKTILEKLKIDPPLPKSKKKRIVKSENMKFVLDRFPNAESLISEDKLSVSIVLKTGEVLGTSNNAPNAWVKAKKAALGIDASVQHLKNKNKSKELK